MSATLISLLIIYQIKHFISDFPLQNSYMLGKFKPDWSFLGPLLAHVGVHGSFTFIIGLIYTQSVRYSFLLSFIDMFIHFFMDRLKAGPKYLGRFKTLTASEFPTATDSQKISNKLFWWSLGLDQFAHHITHYFLIYLIMGHLK